MCQHKDCIHKDGEILDSCNVDPRPEQLDVRLKLINENWEKYNNIQDELEELGHDSNNQQQHDEMEERYCYLTGFIQTKMKELEVAGAPELNVTTELSVKVKLCSYQYLNLVATCKIGLHLKTCFCH